MNIQTQKAIIIEQFKQVEDENLISAIKSMLDYAFQKKNKKIPEAHQQLVNQRFEKVRKIPERLLDWDEVKDRLNAQ